MVALFHVQVIPDLSNFTRNLKKKSKKNVIVKLYF